MELLKIVVVISIAMALSITLTMITIGQVVQEKPPFIDKDIDPSPATTTMHATEKNPIRLSRFLAEDYKNPRAADHCHKNPGICKLQGESYICCNNKCIDVITDEDNCGECKRKCEYTETCCRGECVTLSMDKGTAVSATTGAPTAEYAYMEFAITHESMVGLVPDDEL